jgi:hypothetical protein
MYIFASYPATVNPEIAPLPEIPAEVYKEKNEDSFSFWARRGGLKYRAHGGCISGFFKKFITYNNYFFGF